MKANGYGLGAEAIAPALYAANCRIFFVAQLSEGVALRKIVIPLPTYLVDFLIALNIVLAILVFMGSFYIDRILSFSTFPAVLLITTLFRLALSISTSRLILIEADAGEIIATFGQFVIGD
ncbi:FHIPEP family type III secretion protein, partial [Salmonella enterica]|uniref:FHIPEP family type III secretion protein n=1 Tax=Salmonella enterica TaxID=28901 RepID=UPI001EF9DFB8